TCTLWLGRAPSSGSTQPTSHGASAHLGERPRLRVPPELADPVGSFEVGEHQDVEELGAGSETEGIQLVK
ncbi:MAG: hypothetical protein ACRD1T_15000, partial [Acidimicrobiia bacterium]